MSSETSSPINLKSIFQRGYHKLLSKIDNKPSLGMAVSVGLGGTSVASASVADATASAARLAALPPPPDNLTPWIALFISIFTGIGCFFSSLIIIRNWWRGRKRSRHHS